jgi:hypothetical protein
VIFELLVWVGEWFWRDPQVFWDVKTAITLGLLMKAGALRP